MLDPRQDRALQDLARSIAHSVDALGDTCTAQLLARIALGLAKTARSEELSAAKGTTDEGSKPASCEAARRGRHRHPEWDNSVRRHRPRHRNRP